jgi:hypothetical protein
MALGCGLTSVRGNRGKNYENEPLVPQKHTKKKKKRYIMNNSSDQHIRNKRNYQSYFKNNKYV